MRWHGTMATAAMAAMLIPVAGCSRAQQQLQVENAWVRAPATPGNPGAAYFTLKGGPVDQTLVAVTADVAIRAEMHETMSGGGMAAMKPVRQVAVPAGTTVTFAPGGRHVMLFDLNPTLKRDAKVTLRLTFADGTVLEANAPWVGAGDPSPWQ